MNGESIIEELENICYNNEYILELLSKLKNSIPIRSLPCVRDKHGEIKEQPLKRLVAKIDEELNELKQAIIRYQSFDLPCVVLCKNSTIGKDIAEEAADTVTAITTLEEALGIDAEMRDEAQRRVNAKNMERGRL